MQEYLPERLWYFCWVWKMRFALQQLKGCSRIFFHDPNIPKSLDCYLVQILQQYLLE